MTTKKSVFATLQEVAIKSKVEQKGNLDYISWANAWQMLKEKFPEAQRKVYEHDHTGLNYFTDGKTAYVKVGIIVEGLEHIDYLPIMDFRNNAVLIEKLTCTEVNKAIQRSTAKAIAMHGLGIQLWTGEDLPADPVKPIAPIQHPPLEVGSEDWAKVSKWVSENKNMEFESIISKLSNKFRFTAKEKTALKKLHQD
jgi:hypothetical protein